MANGFKRLIEVALPIREISAESVRDKSLRHGHISTLHLWWARRPLATCRALMFASLVPDPDDPNCPTGFRDTVVKLLKDDIPEVLKGYWRGRNCRRDPDPYRPYDGIPDTPRNRLLTFIAKWSPEYLAFQRGENGSPPPAKKLLDDRCLVKWETSDPDNEQGRAVLDIARQLITIAHSSPATHRPPVVLDPFAGGGAIPLEAARLGCQTIASDYNPVAYLILRATCEFPQKFGKPGRRNANEGITDLQGEVPNVLAYDVERWAKWILGRARERIGHLYPPGEGGTGFQPVNYGKPVVGYLWARTAPCSNPACRAEIPLLRSLLICNKKDKRVALTMTVCNREVTFGIAKGKKVTRTEGTMLNRGDCRCPICEQTTPVRDLRRAGLEGKMGERMVAVITDTPHGKDYRPVEPADLEAFEAAKRMTEGMERPGESIPENQWNIKTWLYGMNTWGSLFNPRQLLAMQTFVSCLHDALAELEFKVQNSKFKHEPNAEYRRAIAAYLGLWVSKIVPRLTAFGRWNLTGEKLETPFDAQAIPMKWDFPEVNPLNEVTGGALGQLNWILRVIAHESPHPDMPSLPSTILCSDGARLPLETDMADIVVTDPPYFDAISYADLSDFFYVWLKRCLGDVFPEAFATPLTPKTEEATALKHRHNGDAEEARRHFTSKLASCLAEARRICKPDGVLAVMFAHQSTEAWTALINALFEAGLNVTATYPVDTELTTALKGNMSALASSITVICRPREAGTVASFRDVRREIENVVAESVHRFFEYGFRGADLIVACYGPAVGVFGRYEDVERADGTPVTIPELLELAKESALRAIAGEFTGDALSRLYFVWANLYGIAEQAWDDARLVVQIGGDSEDAMDVARRHGLFVVNGAHCRLALLRDRSDRRHLGEDDNAALIDQLHRSMQLWKEELRSNLVSYLRERDLLDHTPFWKLAQALFEVLPRGEEDWKLISALLGERETLRMEARQTAAAQQGELF